MADALEKQVKLEGEAMADLAKPPRKLRLNFKKLGI